MVAFEHEPAKGEKGLVTDRDKVSAFLNVAAEFPACSLVILSSKLLRNRRAFGLEKATVFKECKLSSADRDEVLIACTSHGHLSVFFVHPNSDELSRRFLELGFYGQPRQMNFGVDATSPLDAEALQSIEHYLASANGKAVQEMLAFSHDAGGFYRFYPWRRTSRT